MRFSDDQCYRCKNNIIIDVQYYKRKILKFVNWPYRCLYKFFVRDLEKREYELLHHIQKLNKFKNINVDAITPNTFDVLEIYLNKMKNEVNRIEIPEDFKEEFQFIFDLKHDLNEFEKHWDKIKKLPKEGD